MPKNRPHRTVRPLKPVFHIFCEGAKTEPNYLRGYIEHQFPGNRRLKIISIEDTKKNTPVQLVADAIEKQNGSPDGDVFWVIYDRESEQKYGGKLHANACHTAKQHKIGIALSNVCFEVWLLLHFQNTVAAYNSCDDLLKRSNLGKNIKNYEKGDRNIYTRLSDKISRARKNALAMNKQTIKAANPSWNTPHQWNPYTDVYKLLDAMDKFAEDHDLKDAT